MKIGYAGFGAMGKVHSFALRSLPYYYDTDYDAAVAGVCSSSFESAVAHSKRYGLGRAYRSFDEMIADPNIDVIDICSPNAFHFEQIKAAIEKGKHIYCEKPLCSNYIEAKEAAKLASGSDSICGIVFNTRFHLPIIRAKELVGSGAVGDIVSFSLSFLHSSALDPERTGWKQDKIVCGGGVLYDLGSHGVDLIRYLCGEFSEVSGKSQILFEKRTSFRGESDWSTDGDEAFYLTAKLKCGAVGTVTVSKIHTGSNDDLFFEIFGTRGSLKFSLMDPNWLWYYDVTADPLKRGYTKIECVGRFDPPATGFPGPKASVGWLRGHIGCLHNFLSCVHRGETPSPSFDDGAAVQKVLDAAYFSDSHMNGGFVDVDSFPGA